MSTIRSHPKKLSSRGSTRVACCYTCQTCLCTNTLFFCFAIVLWYRLKHYNSEMGNLYCAAQRSLGICSIIFRLYNRGRQSEDTVPVLSCSRARPPDFTGLREPIVLKHSLINHLHTYRGSFKHFFYVCFLFFRFCLNFCQSCDKEGYF